jgi:hypothetical protein
MFFSGVDEALQQQDSNSQDEALKKSPPSAGVESTGVPDATITSVTKPETGEAKSKQKTKSPKKAEARLEKERSDGNADLASVTKGQNEVAKDDQVEAMVADESQSKPEETEDKTRKEADVAKEVLDKSSKPVVDSPTKVAAKEVLNEVTSIVAALESSSVDKVLELSLTKAAGDTAKDEVVVTEPIKQADAEKSDSNSQETSKAVLIATDTEAKCNEPTASDVQKSVASDDSTK